MPAVAGWNDVCGPTAGLGGWDDDLLLVPNCRAFDNAPPLRLQLPRTKRLSVPAALAMAHRVLPARTDVELTAGPRLMAVALEQLGSGRGRGALGPGWWHMSRAGGNPACCHR